MSEGFTFTLTKAISALLLPLPLALGLIVAGLAVLLYTQRRISLPVVLLAGGLLLLLLSTVGNISYRGIARLENQFPPLQVSKHCNPAKRIDYVVVLGGRLVGEKSRPPGDSIGLEVLPRLIEGIRIYRACPGSKLIVTGGSRQGRGFAGIAAGVARSLGVPSSDIIEEGRPLNTASEAFILRERLEDSHFALVTSAWHLPRAVGLFRGQGLSPVPAPAAYVSARGRLLPNSRSLFNSEWWIHEKLGILWAFINKQL